MIRAVKLAFVVALVACGGNHAQSICDNQVPPPVACMTSCDPRPGAPNMCPLGYHCSPDGFCDAFCTPSGDECGDGYRCTDDGQCVSTACQGLECNEVDCQSMGMPNTTISGTVFAPNGTLPLFGVNVYVPNSDPGPFTEGAICDRCNTDLPGSPVVRATTDEAGKFSLGATDMKGAPVGDNIPLIITIGKWRRQIIVPHVGQCADTQIAMTDTALPKNASEGDIPEIAITTGAADALECLIRKLGIDDKEIGTAGGPQRIHLYTDTAAGGGQGEDHFKAGFGGGAGNFGDAKALWSDVNKMKAYDIVIFSCEGAQHPETKAQGDMDAVKAYADLGGRIFMSHWHNIWIEGSTEGGGNQAPAVWPQIATWSNNGPDFDGDDTIDEANNPKGTAFATWMLNVLGSTTRDIIPVVTGRNTCSAVDTAKAERWVYRLNGGQQNPQNFQFTTPVEAAADQRCGKVVFSDMHVSADSQSSPGGTGYPSTCSTAPLTPQEKALAFMFFDIASCVGSIF